MPLNSTQVKTKQPGTHADGGGLYLVVRESGERVWAFRFTAPDGKRATMEFAGVGDKEGQLGLTEARDQARAYRLALKKNGIDPRHKKKIDAKGGKSFKEYWGEKAPGWCVGKHRDELKSWERSLRDIPILHDLKLHEIDTPQVIEALKGIWWEKPITANRTRERIEKVLDAAKVEKYRAGENPAAWRGNLKLVLPSARKLNKKRGHASVPYAKAPALMVELHNDPGRVARCVEVGILTVTRSQEIRLMEWDEINFDKKTWLIPADKMKIKGDGEEKPKDHLVPLTDQAIAIIKSMPRLGRYVFPSDHAIEHQPFFPNALTNCIKRAGFAFTMHGMRTTFRNWGADSKEHNFRREVLEFCLSHRVGDEAELSYWDSDMIDRRRVVMEAWSRFMKPNVKLKSTRTGRVVPVPDGRRPRARLR
ncbi:tyrosine-type recombinase/integrase [Bradyrhizobium lablabi]|uniref:tyrosine-type recombinase/integrase n=1 Tax=Bradyrhizobium lablabi TaxID=722472 RepID=UPI00155FA255|nr:site-specific integrase [Bradyrhizobium lablabi]